MVEAVGPKAMAVLKAVRWEGQEVTSVWMKLMLGGVSGCSVSVYGQVYVRETLGFELCGVCFSELFVYIGNCHVGSIAGLAWTEVLVWTPYSPVLCKLLCNRGTKAGCPTSDEDSLPLET